MIVINAIQLLVVFYNLSVGVIVIQQNPQSLNHKLFSLLCITASIWSFTNYMTTMTLSTVWLQSTFALGSLLLGVGLLWVTVLCEGKMSHTLFIFTCIFSTIFFLSPFQTFFFAESYHPSIELFYVSGKPGTGLGLFSLYYLIFSFLILFQLFKKVLQPDPEQKHLQAKKVLFGAGVTLIAVACTSLILPLFSINLFAGVDNISFIFFLTLVTHTIFKNKLFNLKIISIELVVFLLWSVILTRILFVQSTREILYELGIFLIALVLGIILIRNILLAVNLREENKALIERVGSYSPSDEKA